MNSTAFLLSSNSNPEVDGNQITFGAVDFQPHPSTLTPVFASLDQEMDLMVGSLNFCVGSLGTIRVLDPTRLDLSAEKTAFAAISESSVSSSSEVNSPVNFKPTENIVDTIEELDEIMENLHLGESSGHSDEGSSRNFNSHTIADFTTRSGGVSSCDEGTRRSEGRYTNNIHQMCVTITDAAEDDDGRNNMVVNVQGDNPGTNHRKEREKVYVSTGEWKMIMSAINQGTTIPTDS
jgi:hypothetical protein